MTQAPTGTSPDTCETMTQPSDHTIAERVRAEPDHHAIWKAAGRPSYDDTCFRLAITAYRAMLLADEEPLDIEQYSDRSAP